MSAPYPPSWSAQPARVTFPTRPTPAAQPTRPATPARSTRSTLSVKKTAPLPTPHLSGPRLFQVMRVGLVVWTLVSTVLCLASVLASQSHQEASAGSLIHAQDLRDLRSEVSQAQALALTSLINPNDSGIELWSSYTDSRTHIDLLLLASAASAAHPTDLGNVADALRIWQEDVAVTHHDAVGPGIAPSATLEITASYTDAINAINAELAAAAAQESSSTPFIVLSILASVLGGLGFVVVLVITARRSHRVINIGLSIGLIAIIAAIVSVGVYANRSGQISVTDTRITSLSQAETDAWDSLSRDALSVLEPGAWQSQTDLADTHVTSVRDNLAKLTGVSSASSAMYDLNSRQSSINGTEDLDSRTALVLDETPWQNITTAINTTIDSERPDSTNLVVPALGYVITVATCCVIAIIATLAGIHARTKEYS